MNPDDFEQRLQNERLRQIPCEWRAEILAVLPNQASRFTSLVPWLSTLNTLLWPSPKVWGGLATIWLALLVINSATNDKSTPVASRTQGTRPEAIMAWKEQERLLTELIGSQEMPMPEPPKAVAPRPRSDRQNDFRMS
jgi:hypothetical protein